MRWFKHFTDNHRGRSIQNLMNEMSHQGVASYYFLFEMCAEKLEKLPDRNLEEADCLFRFSPRVVRQTCRISQTNLRRLLDVCQTNGLLSFGFFQNELEIKMPILLDLLDYDSKKSRPRRATIAPESRLEKNREEKNIHTPTDGGDKSSGDTKKKASKSGFDFESAYAFYPKKIGKGAGFKVLAKTIKTEDQYSNLVRAIQNYAKLCQVKGTGDDYILQFSTFVGPADAPRWVDYADINVTGTPKPQPRPFSPTDEKTF